MRKLLLLLSFVVFTFTVNAQYDLTATGGTLSQSYSTLKLAFDAINLGTHTGTITIGVSADGVETLPCVLNASGSGGANYTTITINPTGGAVRTISGAIAAASPLIDLNGADNVTIDGLNSGGNGLIIENTTVAATSGTCTIRFIGGATNNVINRCSIKGAGTMSVATNGATIFFSTDAVTANGNDNNTISNCDIGPSGSNLPTKAILGNGSTTTTAIGNSGNIINNNNIFDYFGAAVTSSGVATNGGCNSWTITNNRFYQTGTRTWTTGATHRAIDINNTAGTSGAQGFTITGNIVGYASNTQTGVYTLTGSTGKFQGIQFSGTSGGAVSDINNNTVASVSLTGVTSSGTSTSSPLTGLLIINGLVNSNNNTVGSQSATGSLVFSTNSTTATDVHGIYNFSNDNWTSDNNTVGGISVTNAAASGTFMIYGIRANTGTTLTWGASTNTVGGNIANSIQLSATGGSSQVFGMQTANAISTLANNTIRNLTTNIGSATAAGASIIGIGFSSNIPTQMVRQNTIHTLNNTNASAASVVTGIHFTGSTGANLVERNFIYGLTVATNSTSAEVNGIRIAGGTTTYRNNMIALGEGIGNAIGAAASNSTTVGINGINESTGNNNFLHNSVYIGGTATAGAGTSCAFNSIQTFVTRSLRNNIFFNARTNGGATGKHYAVKINGTAPNPTGLTINNNLYHTSGTGGVFGFFNSLDVADLATWRTNVGQDAASLAGYDPQFIAPAAATPDLHIHATNPTVIEASGTDLGVADDYDGQTRSGLTPVDMGADAGNFMVNDVIGPNMVFTPLVNTPSTTNRTLVVTITDATGVAAGGNAPRIYYRKTGGGYFAANATSVTGNDYTFTIDYANVTGGSVAAGDVIEYYLAAQDVVGTPNLSSNPAGATGVNPPGTTAPGSFLSYIINPVYTWNGGSSDYQLQTNWNPTRTTPAVTDYLVFDGALTATPTINNIPVQTVQNVKFINNVNATLDAAVGGNDFTISGGSGETVLTIEAGSSFNVGTTTNMDVVFGATAGQLVNIAGTLRLNSTSTYNAFNTVTTVTGLVRNASTTATPFPSVSSTNLIFTTGTYQHDRNGAGAPAAATYQAGSTFNVTGIVGTTLTPPATVGNFIWNCPSQTLANASLSSTLTTINGNCTLENTGSGSMRFGVATSLSIAGNLIVNGGSFQLSGGSGTVSVAGNATFNGGTFDLAASSSNTTLNVAGAFNLAAGGTITESSTSTGSVVAFNGSTNQSVTIAGTVTNNVNWRLANNAGITITGTLPVNNACTFTNASTAVTPVAGTISYNATASTLAYNASGAAQTTTNADWPTTNGPVSVTINNSSGVNLHTDRTIGGVLTFTAGNFNIGNNTLTLNGTVSGGSASRAITSGGNANISIGGTGALGSVFFDQTNTTTNLLNNLTLARTTSGTATLGNAVGVKGTVSLTDGTLNTGGFLTLRSTAGGTGRIAAITGTGAVSGNVTLQTFVAGGRRAFRFLSHPFNAATNVAQLKDNIFVTGADGFTNGFDSTLLQNPSAFWFNDAAAAPGAWTAFTHATTDNNWKQFGGARVLVRGDRTQTTSLTTTGVTPNDVTLDVSGVLNTGDANINLTNANNYHFVGNPYPSPVDIGTVINGAADIGTQYWLWDPRASTKGAYVTKTVGGGAYSIPSGSAFFVQPTAGTTLAFTEANKTASASGPEAYFRTTAQDMFEIKMLYNNYPSDNMFVRHNAAASAATELTDGKKLMNSDMNMYTLSTTPDKLSLDSRPIAVNTIIPMGFTTNELTASYAFVITDNGLTGMDVYLKDKFLNIEQKMLVNTPYNFTVSTNPASQGEARFELVFRASSPLPVSFLNIKAYQQNAGINVEWNVGAEVNVAGYDVEESTDGRTFTKSTTVTATGNNNYSWFDANVNSGDNFYRIKSTDRNGTVKYSLVVNVKLGRGKNEFTVYPNPVKEGKLNLQLGNVDKGQYSLRLYNSIGQEVMSQTLTHAGGSATQSITLAAGMAKGVYRLQISNGTTVTNKSVVIE